LKPKKEAKMNVLTNAGSTLNSRIKAQAFKLAAPALLILAIAVGPVAAQSRESRDIDHPVRLTSSEITRPIAENREIFYTFVAGPGELTMTLDLLQEDVGATVEVTIYDMNAKQIASFYGWALEKTTRRVERVNFPRRQQALMKISVTYSSDHYKGDFRLRLAGALDQARSESGPSAVPGATGGVLRILMRDGSVQEIVMRQVQQITVTN